MTDSAKGSSALPAALRRAFELLRCPHCGAALVTGTHRTVSCAGPRPHPFDLSRYGYLTLFDAKANRSTADSANMVAHRVAFLDAGHYGPIMAAVAAAIPGAGVAVDVGGGTGHYLRAVAPEVGLVLDNSDHALRQVVRGSPPHAAVRADVWRRLPVADAAADAATVIFAPRAPAELARILRPGGTLVTVTPEPDHLAELREPLGLLAVDAGKAQRLADDAAGAFTPRDATRVRFPMTLSHNDIEHLVGMGPTARHRSAEQLAAAIATLADPVTVTADVTVGSWQRA
ncbi:methyltransferase domain-containing protein [Nakamurella aerolata]|uniref:Methyltransferase type 11 domain-containing protein n=1 Tax=Nakamurella aerolata TaxID=1656892 RepID=A0A849A752_9ACTN|nr:methyltransferase domain-containing protein [Nakamurella aerolata]NNG34861.1 hypothetical protein [Nakamurella aerolata]